MKKNIIIVSVVIVAGLAAAFLLPDDVQKQVEVDDENINDTQMTSETDKYKNKIAVLKTSMGDIELAFFPEDAPKAVENFIRLAESGYYNGVTFHRVVKDFVIQGGDPTGTGAGGESVFGPTFEDELDPITPSYQRGYKKGVLAMANSGPNTNGSQFFILLKDNPLPHLYTIFGEVLSGQDVVDKIGLVEVGLGDKPLVDVVIEQVIIQ